MLIASAVASMLVDGVAFHAELQEECVDPVRAAERSGEKNESTAWTGSSPDDVVGGPHFVRRGNVRSIRQTRRLGRRSGLRWNASSCDARGESRRRMETGFIEVHDKGNDYPDAGDEHVERTGRSRAPSEIDFNLRLRIHTGFVHGWLGFDGERFAPKWHDAHDGGFVAGHDLERRVWAPRRR
eukprot:1234301-Pleurochrysis_carterae.AAC.1